MKKNFTIILLYSLIVYASVIDDFSQFRKNMRMVPGEGIGRSTQQVFQEQCGNPMELTLALQESLAVENVHTYSGKIELNAKQRSAWSPVAWEDWCDLLGEKGSDYCPFSWLAVPLPAIPELGCGQEAAGAFALVEIFPGLCGGIRINSSLLDCVSENGAVQLLHILESSSIESEEALILPYEYLQDEVEQLLGNFSDKYDGKNLFVRNPEHFPGYVNAETRSPVFVRERKETSFPHALIQIEIQDPNGKRLLEYKAKQSELTGRKIDLQWRQGKSPTIVWAGECVAVGENASFKELQLVISRLVGKKETDKLYGVLNKGQDISLVLSSGTSILNGESTCERLRKYQDQAVRLLAAAFGVYDRRQLFATLGTTNMPSQKLEYLPLVGNGLVSLSGLDNTEKQLEELLVIAIEKSDLDLERLFPILRMCAKMYEVPVSNEAIRAAGVRYLLEYGLQQLFAGPQIDEIIVSDEYLNEDDFTVEAFLVNTRKCSLEIKDRDGRLVQKLESFEDEVNLQLPDDGTYTIELTAYGDVYAIRQSKQLIKDTQAPDISIYAKARHKDSSTYIYSAIDVMDEHFSEIEVQVADAAGNLVFSAERKEEYSELWIPVTMEGMYSILVTAKDLCGNVAEKTILLDVQSILTDEIPEVTVFIRNLNEARRLVSRPFSALVQAKGLVDISRLEMYLDGELIGKIENSSVLETLCETGALESMRHELTGIAYDSEGNAHFSNVAVFYYVEAADDCFVPIIDVSMKRYPFQAGDILTITARDETQLFKIDVYQNNKCLETRNFPEGTTMGTLDIMVPEMNYPIDIVATDVSGNKAQRSIKLQGEGIARLFLESDGFDGKEHDETVPVYARGENAQCIVLYVNHEEYSRIYYPENGFCVFSIGNEDLLDGNNEVYAIAYASGQSFSETSHFQIKVPVVRQLSISPRVVCPYLGTSEQIEVKGWMRSEHEWQVSLLDTAQVITGTGKQIDAVLDTKGLADGTYILQVSVPELDYCIRESITIDAVQNNPVALIDYPEEGQVIKDGVLYVLGSATTSDDDTEVPYSMSLRDAEGTLLGLYSLGDGDEWHLEARPVFDYGKITTPQHQGRINHEVLAALDLSNIPDGSYTLSLSVEFHGQRAEQSISFILNSNLKASPFEFNETDFTAQAGGLSVKFGRNYSTLQAASCGNMGYGWKNTLLFERPVMHEERGDVPAIDDTVCSLRQGGTRDISVQMADGSTRRFQFVLEAGGGYSFCYYAKWKPVGGKGTMTPNCSDKLMTLPGMEPYWEAAGPSTPWEMFDFPSFTMTDEDGNVYTIEREYLGSADIIQGGEPAFVEAYGNMYVSQITLTDGITLRFDDNRITAQSLSGVFEDVLRYELDEGRIIAAYKTDAPAISVEYEYDKQDNLCKVHRSVNGQDFALYRHYEYENADFPHHLTGIKDGHGRTLASITYNSSGQMIACTGINGATCSNKIDVFAGYDVQTDALGNETVLEYDTCGNITSRTLPNGAQLQYEYDSDGNELQVTNPVGGKITKQYDSAGRMTSRTGGISNYYEYTGKLCSRITDDRGHVTEYAYDKNGRPVSIITSSDHSFYIAYDEQGRVTERTHNGIKLKMMYDKKGNLSTMVSDYGMRYDMTYNDMGNMTEKSVTLYHPVTGEEITGKSIWEYDDEGRCTYMEDADGNWTSSTYDEDGRCIEYRDFRGMQQQVKYDVAGRAVEIIQNASLVQRMGYDLAGNIVFKTDFTDVSDYGENMRFARCQRYSYNSVGQNVSMEVLQNANVLLEEENGAYSTQLINAEKTVSISNSEYDLAGRLKKSVSAEGNESTYTYSSTGKVLSETDVFGRSTMRSYDKVGRLSSVTNRAGGVSFFDYDAHGNVNAYTSPDGFTRKQIYSPRGALLEKQTPDGARTIYERTANGELLAVTMPKLNGNTASFGYEYDSVGAVSAIRTPLGGSFIYENDQHGRCEVQHRPSGEKCRFIYKDNSVSPSEYVDYCGNRNQFSYDMYGNMVSCRIISSIEENCHKEYSYVRNSLGQLTAIELTENDEKRSCIYGYNADGELESERVDNHELHYDYDLDGRLIKLKTMDFSMEMAYSKTVPECEVTAQFKNQGEEKLQIQYDAFDMVSLVLRPDGSQRIIERNTAGQVINISEKDRKGQVLCQLEYAYDSCGRLMSCDEHWSDGYTRQRRWEYDAWARLTKEVSVANEAWADYVMQWSYDANGNMLHEEKGDASGKSIADCIYDVDDRLVSRRETLPDGTENRFDLQWNANGQLLAIRLNGEAYRQYAWNAEGQLKQVELCDENRQVSYIYDARGLLSRRVQSKNGITEKDDSICFMSQGEQLHSCGERIYLDIGGKIQSYSEQEKCRYFTDIAGSVIGYYDGQSTLHHSGYTARGIVLTHEGIDEIEVGYCGELQDAHTELVYLRSRYYMPSLGIFISPDKVRGNIEEPQTLNQYAYCMNDPVNHVDPKGTFAITLSMAVTGAALSMVALGISAIHVIGRAHAMNIFYKNQNNVENQKKEHNTASIIVHGVAVHKTGYADEDMVPLLKAKVADMDFYQLVWSGFAIYLLHMPNAFEHYVAVSSLVYDYLTLKMRFYDKISILSHSWGTVVSKDFLTESVCDDEDIGLWATMGSPLTNPDYWKSNWNPLTIFNHVTTWQNYYLLSDPVTHFGINSPGGCLILDPTYATYKNLCVDDNKRLILCLHGSTVPFQVKRPGTNVLTAHSSYWTDPVVIACMSSYLNSR